MNKNYYFTGLVFLISLVHINNASAQLTEQQKLTLKFYIEKSPSLGKYNANLKDRILNDASIVPDLQPCWNNLKKYADIERISNLEDMTEMYSQLGMYMPELRNKFLPDFVRNDYKAITLVAQGNTLKINPAMHASTLTVYYAARKDKLSLENAFGSLIILYPEKIEELRKAATASLKMEVNDRLLNIWLEIKYFDQMRLAAIRRMNKEQLDMGNNMEKGCLSFLTKKFEEENDKENNAPQNPAGLWSNVNFTIQIEQRGQFYFGKYDMKVGSQSESMQWNLTVTGKDGIGDWTMVYVDNEKIMTHTGPMTIIINGDEMEYEMKYLVEPKVEWNEGYKPRDLGIKYAGGRLFGKLTRNK